MSKENVQRFLEEAASTPELGGKLRELQESHIQQLIALAEEAGVSLTSDDFTAAAQPLSNEQAENISGGYIFDVMADAGHYFK